MAVLRGRLPLGAIAKGQGERVAWLPSASVAGQWQKHYSHRQGTRQFSGLFTDGSYDWETDGFKKYLRPSSEAPFEGWVLTIRKQGMSQTLQVSLHLPK